jgi:hypothetical protein
MQAGDECVKPGKTSGITGYGRNGYDVSCVAKHNGSAQDSPKFSIGGSENPTRF